MASEDDLDFEENLDFLEGEDFAEDKQEKYKIAKGKPPAPPVVEKPEPAEGDDDDEMFELGPTDAVVAHAGATKPFLGTVLATIPSNYTKGPKDDEAPDQYLEIDFVHGYRGHDSRDNLVCTKSGKLVYPTAALGIVYDPITHTQRFFKGHDDDIMSCAIHPDGRTIATGQVGKTPTIHVWDSETCEKLATLSGHLLRAVVSVCFSPDGRLVAGVGADDNHSVAVYDWRQQSLVAQAKGDASKTLSLRFNPHDSTKLIACGVRHMRFLTISASTLKSSRGVFGSKDASPPTVLSATFLPPAVGKTEAPANVCVTSSAAGALIVWKGSGVSQVVKNAHVGPVHTTFFTPTSNVLISGGSDGKLNFYTLSESNLKLNFQVDLPSNFGGAKNSLVPHAICCLPNEERVVFVGCESGEIVRVVVDWERQNGQCEIVMQAHGGPGGNTHIELWGLSPSPSSPTNFYTVSDDGFLCQWDAISRKLIAKCVTTTSGGSPARSCGVSMDGALIGVGHKDGKITLIDAKSLSVIWQGTRGSAEVSVFKFSPDNTKFAVAGHDDLGRIDVYKFGGESGPELVGKCVGNSASTLHADWSMDSRFLQTVAASTELLYWDTTSVSNGKIEQITSATRLKGKDWATWTCNYGWCVQGIYPKDSDSSDINTVFRSNGGTLLVTGDDFRHVNMYRYPAIGGGLNSKTGHCKDRPQYHSYKGHSEHVTNVGFLSDDSLLISTGGADRTIIQWKLRGGPDRDAVNSKIDATRAKEPPVSFKLPSSTFPKPSSASAPPPEPSPKPAAAAAVEQKKPATPPQLPLPPRPSSPALSTTSSSRHDGGPPLSARSSAAHVSPRMNVLSLNLPTQQDIDRVKEKYTSPRGSSSGGGQRSASATPRGGGSGTPRSAAGTPRSSSGSIAKVDLNAQLKTDGDTPQKAPSGSTTPHTPKLPAHLKSKTTPSVGGASWRPSSGGSGGGGGTARSTSSRGSNAPVPFSFACDSPFGMTRSSKFHPTPPTARGPMKATHEAFVSAVPMSVRPSPRAQSAYSSRSHSVTARSASAYTDATTSRTERTDRSAR